MGDRFRVLVVETERGAADGVAHDLGRAGHEVLRCHEPGAPAFPCAALDARRSCPVLDGIVDVAVTVRSHPSPQPTALEDGAGCALRHHVPLVVAGATALNPYEAWATEVLDRSDDVVAACERAATAPLAPHGARAAATLAEVLRRRGVSDAALDDVDVLVERRDGRLVVRVRGGDLDRATKSMASVRLLGALRAFDRDAAGIDVAFESATI
jgi:hypothetical protein